MAMTGSIKATLAGVSDLKHGEQSFTIRLNGSVAEVTPLFGPVREAEWAPGWTPEFAYPPNGNQAEGAVFTTKGDSDEKRIWLLTTYNEQRGQVVYVVVAPGASVSEIKIVVSPGGPNNARATVTYRRTALTAKGNPEVEKLNQGWAEQQRNHWESAINQALLKAKNK